MKHYYFNPKSQDLHIFDTESKDLMVLERIVGIRVLTSSELDRPTDEPVKHWANSAYDPKDGKAHPNYDGPSNRAKRAKKSIEPKEKVARAARKLMCKKCGRESHFAKTCTNPPKAAPAQGTE
jgi:hypothetical protein